MSTGKMEATMKGVNELKNEISAWDMRLESIKGEIQGLQVKRDAYKKEIEQLKANHNQDIDKKNMALRSEAAKVADEKEALEKQRNEFSEILISFKKDKAAFDREKTDTLDMKVNYEKMNEKVGQFVMLVKRASEAL